MLKKIYNTLLYGFAIIGAILILGYVISKSGLTNKDSLVDEKTDYFKVSRNLTDQKTYAWLNTPEYISLKNSIKKEQTVLVRVEKETGVKSRLLTTLLFVEQMRLFTSDRELFKQVFEPLKLLGVQSQFSWGVLGLKQDTLIEIENNLTNPLSPYYLGPDYEKALDFTGSSQGEASVKLDEERFMRVTDEHNHYYTYLYAAIFIKQIEKQWFDAGFSISDRPEILATLYNIGFANSKPNADPKSGGAEIEIDHIKYSFGQLAYEFYYSDELLDIFPR